MQVSSARSSVVVALFGFAVTACGAATPASNTAANASSADTAVVNLDATRAPGAPKAEAAVSTGSRVKGEEGTMGEADAPDPHVARAAALRDAAELGKVGVLKNLDVDVAGILGALKNNSSNAGVIGGLGGLSGLGLGGGGTGTGIGLGSIGTIGVGSGGGGWSSSSYSSNNPVPGTAIVVGSTTIIDLGDSATLGVSLEQATRAIRDRVHVLRDCYSKALERNKQAEGSADFRFVIGKDGRIEYARATASTLRDDEAIACITKGMKDAYVQIPSAGLFGVIETTIRFRPAPKK